MAAVAGFIRLAADIVIAEMIRDATDTGQLSYADLYYAVTLLGGVATAINKMETAEFMQRLAEGSDPYCPVRKSVSPI